MLQVDSIEKTNEYLRKSITPTAIQTIQLTDSYGYVLANDLKAPINLPFYETSSMDGWAVNGSSPWREVAEIGRAHV